MTMVVINEGYGAIGHSMKPEKWPESSVAVNHWDSPTWTVKLFPYIAQRFLTDVHEMVQEW